MSRALLHLMIALQAAASGLVPLVLCIHPDGEVEVRTGALLDSCCRPARAEAPPDRQPEARPRSGSPCPGCQDVSLGASSPQAFPMRTAAPPIGLESSAVAAAPCIAAVAANPGEACLGRRGDPPREHGPPRSPVLRL